MTTTTTKRNNNSSLHCTECATPLSGPCWTPQRPGAWHRVCTLEFDNQSGAQVKRGDTLRFRRGVAYTCATRVQQLCATCYLEYLTPDDEVTLSF